MKERHKKEAETLSKQLENSARKEEREHLDKAEKLREQAVREKRNKQAAELAARKDLSQAELAAVSSQSIHTLLNH